MIVTRTPLRITLGGGGTDLPSYYQRSIWRPGVCVSAAIDKYVYVTVNRNFNPSLRARYSEVEEVVAPAQLNHRLLRAIFELEEWDNPQLELAAMADVPAGTGLGSSGAFTVGTLHALRAYRHQSCSAHELADDACAVEIGLLRDPVGKQDQFAAAYGGVSRFTFNDEVQRGALTLDAQARHDLEDNLLLFYTGIRRDAAQVLASAAPLDMDEVRLQGIRAGALLECSHLREFGAFLSEQWQLKFLADPSPLNQRVNDWLSSAVEAGALGGKLVGAGGGGFLLLYVEEKKAAVRKVMTTKKLQELRFCFDYSGSQVIVR